MNCLKCNKEFKERGKGKGSKKFCSQKCQILYWKNTIKGKEQIEKYKKKKVERKIILGYILRNYKCLSCNYTWKSWSKDKEKLPYSCSTCKSNRWDFEPETKCFFCNKLPLIPSIHHRDGNHKNNIKENRILLCYKCHAKLHNGIKEYKKFNGQNIELEDNLKLERRNLLKVWSKI